MGLLLGTIVVASGVLSDQQTTLVSGLQKDFNQIRAESAALKAQNETLAAFSNEAAPTLITGALDGRLVLVIAAPESGDTVARIKSVARAAGANVAVATFTTVGLSLGDPDVAAAAAAALGASGSVNASSVLTGLAREWSTPGDPRVLTKALTTAGGLKLTGLTSTATVDGIAVTAAYAGKPDPLALALAGALSGGTVPALGVETTKRTDGTAAAAKALGISGVDNVDTSIGSVSLVWVLAGRASGYYGVGQGAIGTYPTPLFPKP
jgi:hypothetical protein